MEKKDLLRDQLGHAHQVNKLVDNHRFRALQLLLALHGLVLGSLTFNPALQSFALGALTSMSLAIGLSAVGLGLFAVFLSQHIYMRTFKYWISALEAHLHEVPMGAKLAAHKGTLSWDENTPYVWPEPTFVVLASLFVLLNVGVPSLLATILGVPLWSVAVMATGILVVHLGVVVVLLASTKSPRGYYRANKPTDAGPVTQPHYHGNAREESNDRGWFLGSFMSTSHPLLQRPSVEAKWGLHKKGEERSNWAEGRPGYTLTILIRGRITQEYRDGSHELSSEGDFALYGPGVPHRWKVEEDSLVITFRWREV